MTTGLGIATALAVLGSVGPAHAAGDLVLVPDLRIVALYIVVFAILIYPVNRLLLQPLVRTLVERQRRSEGALERAASLRDEAAAAGVEVERRSATARAEAQRRRLAILSEASEEERALIGAARGDADRAIEAVRASVAAELTDARQALRNDARALARDAAARVLGRELQ